MCDSVIDIAAAIAQRKVRAIDVCEEALGRITASEPELGAFLQLTDDYARDRARHIDQLLDAGHTAGPLAGVPFAIKDNVCTQFCPTTAGSRILASFVPPYAATVVARLEQAGAVIVGKTNMDEFGMGSSNEHSAFRPTRNPWSSAHVPGGSSGGSAAAVSAGLVPAAIGSDTGGSIRQPAAFCGITGLKPTYGRVSRYGLIAYGSSFDQIGPLTRDACDAARVLGVIAGHDPTDTTAAPHPVPDYEAELAATAQKPMKIGLPREYFADGLDPVIGDALRTACEVFTGDGAELVDVSLPRTNVGIAAYYLIVTAECASNLARYDGMHFSARAERGPAESDLATATRTRLLGDEVKRRIMLGNFALAAGHQDRYYLKAQRVRRLVQRDFDAAFEQADVLLAPTTPTPAFRRGEKVDEPLQMFLADVFTLGANLAGLPAISVPCGFTAGGLPLGMQLIAPAFCESRLLRAAHRYQCATDYHRCRPPGAP